MKTLFNYFLCGMLFSFSIFATLYIIYLLMTWANDLFNRLLFDWVTQDIPGLGLLTALVLIIMLGYLGTRTFVSPMFSYAERLLRRTPVVSIIYLALKDLTEAFVGEKKKFNRPVIVSFTEHIDRIGFVTEKQLDFIGLSDRVDVYCPHSYNFSGNLFLVNPDRVRPLNVNPTEAMKFAVSAGVTYIELES